MGGLLRDKEWTIEITSPSIRSFFAICQSELCTYTRDGHLYLFSLKRQPLS